MKRSEGKYVIIQAHKWAYVVVVVQLLSRA